MDTITIKKLKKCAFRLCIGLGLILTIGCAIKSEPHESINGHITIGAILPLTNDASGDVLHAVNGLWIAKGEINNKGGLPEGKRLDVIVLNDEGNSDYARHHYRELKAKGAVAIIGSIDSRVAMTLAKVAASDGTPLFLLVAPDTHTNVPNNIYYMPSSLFNPEDIFSEHLAAEYSENFFREPPPISTAAYACVQMLSEAVGISRNTRPEEMILAIRATKQWQSIFDSRKPEA